MIRPDAKELAAFAHLARHNREVVDFLKRWEQREVSELPRAVDNVGIKQGRCQILQDLVKLVQDAQDSAAKR